MNREELIEEAAKAQERALRAVSDLAMAAHPANMRRDDAEFLRGHIQYSLPPIRAVLAVFEKAHAPTECAECRRTDSQHKLGCGQRSASTDDEPKQGERRMTETKYLDAEFCGHVYPEEGDEIHVAGEPVDMICLASPISVEEAQEPAPEPQGEPSDAQVEAALHAYHQKESRAGFVWLDSAVENMRAALRAAGEVAHK